MITAVDLFAGAGGLSVGLHRAGAQVLASFEADKQTARTYAANHPDTLTIVRELTFRSQLSRSLQELPDVLAGGPPCRGWSSLGRRAAVETRARHNAGIEIFLRQARLLCPKAIVMENVRGFAVADHGRRLTELLAELDALGYEADARLVRAADVGVPQLRHRLFVLAVRRDLGVGLPPPFTPLVAPPTVADALGDLPALEAGEQASEYARPAETPLQRALRGNEAVLTWHEAPAHAPAMLRLIKALPLEGGTRSDLASAVAPASGFHNTYGRLRSDRPAPAVTSSIGRVSSGRHVHPTQHRALTPREAARLQTFPDSYRWKGNRWAVYAQIGNAVPPMLAAAIAGPLLERLGSSYAAPRRAA